MKATFENRMEELNKSWEYFSDENGLIVMTFSKPKLIGVFTDIEILSECISQEGLTQFFTVLHKVNPKKIIELPHNQFGKLKAGQGIKKEDIISYRYIFVDVDVADLRKNAINGEKRNATLEEHKEAVAVAEEIIAYLRGKGFPSPLVNSSGNGMHILYPMDGEPNNATDDIIQSFLKEISSRFHRDNIKVDTVVGDRARKIRLPGSWNNKELEHKRVARVKSTPQKIEKISIKQLSEIAKNGNSKKGWKGSPPEEKSEKDKIIEIAEQKVEYFYNQNNQPFAMVALENGRKMSYPLKSLDFQRRFHAILIDEAGIKLLKPSMWKSLLGYMDTLVYRSKTVRKVYNRIGMDEEGNILYDIQNEEYECIKIDGKEVKKVKMPDGMFYRLDGDFIQCSPKIGDTFNFMKEMKRLFNFDQKSIELFVIWLISCFVPNCTTPLLLLTGEQGTGKSTASEQIMSIVSPQGMNKCFMPTKTDDMVTLLANRYITVLDNANDLNKNSSDVLCQTITGGTYAKRELYSNGSLYSVPLQGIVVINGVENIVSKPDLLSRALVFNLKKLDGGRVMTDEQLRERFEKKKPYLLGKIFSVVSCLLADETPIENNDYVIRLTAFQNLAIKVGKILFGKDSAYVKGLLKRNKAEADILAYESNPLALFVGDFMENQRQWTGSVQEFYKELKQYANERGMYSRAFPQSDSSLSRSMNMLKTTLETVGISFDKRNIGKHKQLIILNNNYTEQSEENAIEE